MDEILESWVVKGYHLFSTHFVGAHRDGQNNVLGDQMIFVLAKN